MSLLALFFQIATILLARAVRFLNPLSWRRDVLEVNLDGDMPEELPHAGFIKRFFRTRVPFRDYLFTLREAKEDPNLRAVVFRVRAPDIGWTRAWELRGLIKELRDAGLATTAFLESADNLSYFIAAACDEIFLVPSGRIRISGLAGEVIFLKKTLDKFGIKAEMAHAGKYKSGHEMFTRGSMSKAHREEVNDVLDNLFEFWIGEIARDRRIGEKDMRNLVNKGDFLAAEAKEAGLADRLCYEDQIMDIYEERLRRRPRRVGMNRYASYRALDLPLKTTLKTKPRVAVLYATGPITGGSSSDFGPTGRSAGADSISESLRQIREDRDIVGAVIRIDSPGGGSLASDLIWREMKLTALKDKKEDDKDRKPVVVSMGDVAASGGYYIASTADKIFAGPTTITGSIGVFGGKFNVGGLAEMLGVNVETVTRGDVADMESVFRGYTPKEKKRLKNDVKAVYRDFIDRVSVGRAMTSEQVEDVAEGRVWLGLQASKNGLVDSMGGFLAAIDEVKTQAGVPAGEKAIIDIYPKKKKVVRLPFGLNASDKTKMYVKETLVSLLPAELRRLIPLLREDGPLAVMAYILRIR